MNKKITSLLAGCICLSFVFGCGANPNSVSQKVDSENTTTERESEKSDTIETEENESDEICSIGDNTSLKDWEITVTDAQFIDSISMNYVKFKPKEEGDKYIQVFVTVSNNGKQAATFLPTVKVGDTVYTKVLYGDGFEFTPTTLLGYDEDLHNSTINPLSSRTGEIVFEIPESVADSTDELIIQFISGKDIVSFKIR